jgi:hypothetical protein
VTVVRILIFSHYKSMFLFPDFINLEFALLRLKNRKKCPWKCWNRNSSIVFLSLD